MNHLRVAFAPYWQSIQHALFPQLERVLGPLTEKQQQLVQTLEVIRIEQMIPRRFRVPGRPPKDRAAMARALVAKAVYDMPTTRVLLDRLDTDVVLRRICGWERRSEVPSESVFSRAFAEFSDTQLPQRVHEALIWNTHRDRLVGHLSRDSTAIEAREKPAAKEKAPPPPKRKRGRLKKGEERPKVLKRLDRQATMSLPAMLDDLPTACDVGMKKDSKGYKSTWVGYKLHIDVADGQIPISCLLTSASLHDSQAAIPLATLSAGRTTNLYDLMDAAYDAEPIRQHSRSLSHVPLIDTNPRRDKTLAEVAAGFVTANRSPAPEKSRLSACRAGSLQRLWLAGKVEKIREVVCSVGAHVPIHGAWPARTAGATVRGRPGESRIRGTRASRSFSGRTPS